MHYRLDVYRPGSSESDGCIKSLGATAAFLSVRVGDLINTKTWERNAELPLLRAVNVEHLISEIPIRINPSGRITHRILLYTESVPDRTETRCRSLGSPK
jgi:hypothetical protein